MRLGRLTALEQEKIETEYRELQEKIAYFRDVLAKPELVSGIIKDELTEIKQKYGDERRTSITAEESEIDMEDLIKDEPIVVTLTRFGYIKRISSSAYKTQKRGEGYSRTHHQEDDIVVDMFTTTTHKYILFFTNKGRAYKLRAWQIPEAGRQARGTAIVNLLNLMQEKRLTPLSASMVMKRMRILSWPQRMAWLRKRL